MKRVAMIVMALAAVAFLASLLPAHASAAEGSADRVVVMYFHRTQRCPTCQKMGAYSEEAVTAGFAQQLQAGKVAFHYINFEDPKNAAFTQGYGVAGPALIVAQVVDNKVAQYKNLKEIWAKSRDKAAFIEYVQTNVRDYVNPKAGR